MSKKILFSVGMLVIGLICFAIAIKYIGVREVLDQFRAINPREILLYLLVSLCIVIVLIWKWKIILGSLGYRVPFFNLFMYRQMGYAVGYVVPSFYIGGESIRAYLLKRHKVPITDAVSSVVIDRAVELPMNFLLACIMFFIVINTLNLPIYVLVGIGLIILSMILLCAMFYYKVYSKEYFFTYFFDLFRLGRIRRLAEMKKGIMEMETSLIRFFNSKFRYFMVSVLISILLWIAMIFEFWFALRIVGYQATFSQIYLVVVMTGISMMIPMPASVGVMELGQIGICVLVGIPPAVAIALSLLVRTRDFMWILSGLVFYIYNGTSYVKMLFKDMRVKSDELKVKL